MTFQPESEAIASDDRACTVGKNGLKVAVLRPAAYDIAYGVWPAMLAHGGPNDAWPGMLEKVLAAQIGLKREKLSPSAR